jgi:regulator-associated protein of mTOR
MSADMLTLRPRSAHLPLESTRDNDHHNHQDENGEDGEHDAPELHRNAARLRPNGFNRSNTSLWAPNSRSGSRNPSPAPPPLLGRPGLVRAKSDFGPRREENGHKGAEETESKDGEWGLRHGFETQLESEEYNRLLESVGDDYMTCGRYVAG